MDIKRQEDRRWCSPGQIADSGNAQDQLPKEDRENILEGGLVTTVLLSNDA